MSLLPPWSGCSSSRVESLAAVVVLVLAATGPVVATVGNQSSAGVTFTVTSTPTGPIISKLEPDSGPAGTEIKII
ncbi:MAG: hypothetical protein F4Z21_14640 [Acidobacteria bacterium]|nr:hypothetical protein [Acidobacteriota bacterium]